MIRVCVSLQPKAQKGKPAEKVVHPYSRKAAYLAREEIRLKKKERSEDSSVIDGSCSAKTPSHRNNKALVTTSL